MLEKEKKWKKPIFFQKTRYVSITIKATVKPIYYLDRAQKSKFTEKKWACPCAHNSSKYHYSEKINLFTKSTITIDSSVRSTSK